MAGAAARLLARAVLAQGKRRGWVIEAPGPGSTADRRLDKDVTAGTKDGKTMEAPSPRKRVLIVDPSADNREVLATALDRAGVEIIQATELRAARQMLASQPPQLVVVDEASLVSEPLPSDRSPTEPAWIVLGTFRPCGGGEQVEVVAKPYHYAPLIRRILALLEATHP